MRRGEVWWADLTEPNGSEPGYHRPVLVVQADAFNKSRIETVLVVAFTSNLRLAASPGNVLLEARTTGLRQRSVANVTQLVVINKDDLTERIGLVGPAHMRKVDNGLRLVLSL